MAWWVERCEARFPERISIYHLINGQYRLLEYGYYMYSPWRDLKAIDPNSILEQERFESKAWILMPSQSSTIITLLSFKVRFIFSCSYLL